MPSLLSSNAKQRPARIKWQPNPSASKSDRRSTRVFSTRAPRHVVCLSRASTSFGSRRHAQPPPSLAKHQAPRFPASSPLCQPTLHQHPPRGHASSMPRGRFMKLRSERLRTHSVRQWRPPYRHSRRSVTIFSALHSASARRANVDARSKGSAAPPTRTWQLRSMMVPQYLRAPRSIRCSRCCCRQVSTPTRSVASREPRCRTTTTAQHIATTLYRIQATRMTFMTTTLSQIPHRRTPTAAIATAIRRGVSSSSCSVVGGA